MFTTSSHRAVPLGVLLASAVLLAAACTSATTPAVTFGPGESAGPSAEASSPATPEPTATPEQTAAATPFVAGTKAAPRKIAVAMSDAFAFEPADLSVQAGETVTFVVTNPGVIGHDFTIGDAQAQEDHAMEMMEGGMHHGADTNAIAVDAGKTVELTFTFGEPVEWLIGCHVPGHYEAGMKGVLHVVASMG